ncbi:MAG: 2OG-Fe(II) oxygenase [Alphaproteobacteria bacterium]|nr:2OG-Fe(II) oxygenase [Alphaproteobacteria bacterium]
MTILDFDRLNAVPLERDPFDFVVVEEFVHRDALAAVAADFPAVSKAGSYPINGLKYGPAFGELAAELTGPDLADAIAAKFGIDLDGRPTTLTVRGMGDSRDGYIHTDTETKIITLLLYMNPVWPHSEGRLRLLRGANDIDDYAREIVPLAGTMLAFRRSERSFHGHLPFIGPRRTMQLNWVRDHSVVRRELGRHRWSARLKALNPFTRAA